MKRSCSTSTATIRALERVGEAAYGAEDDPLTRQYREAMGG